LNNWIEKTNEFLANCILEPFRLFFCLMNTLRMHDNFNEIINTYPYRGCFTIFWRRIQGKAIDRCFMYLP